MDQTPHVSPPRLVGQPPRRRTYCFTPGKDHDHRKGQIGGKPKDLLYSGAHRNFVRPVCSCTVGEGQTLDSEEIRPLEFSVHPRSPTQEQRIRTGYRSARNKYRGDCSRRVDRPSTCLPTPVGWSVRRTCRRQGRVARPPVFCLGILVSIPGDQGDTGREWERQEGSDRDVVETSVEQRTSPSQVGTLLRESVTLERLGSSLRPQRPSTEGGCRLGFLSSVGRVSMSPTVELLSLGDE